MHASDGMVRPLMLACINEGPVLCCMGRWVYDGKLCQTLAEAAAEAGSAAAQEAALREAHAAAEGALRAEASQRPLLA